MPPPGRGTSAPGPGAAGADFASGALLLMGALGGGALSSSLLEPHPDRTDGSRTSARNSPHFRMTKSSASFAPLPVSTRHAARSSLFRGRRCTTPSPSLAGSAGRYLIDKPVILRTIRVRQDAWPQATETGTFSVPGRRMYDFYLGCLSVARVPVGVGPDAARRVVVAALQVVDPHRLDMAVAEGDIREAGADSLVEPGEVAVREESAAL